MRSERDQARADLARVEALAAERLRECEQYAEQFKDIMGYDHMDRANRLESSLAALEAEVVRLREAIRSYAEMAHHEDCTHDECRRRRAAKAALGEEGK